MLGIFGGLNPNVSACRRMVDGICHVIHHSAFQHIIIRIQHFIADAGNVYMQLFFLPHDLCFFNHCFRQLIGIKRGFIRHGIAQFNLGQIQQLPHKMVHALGFINDDITVLIFCFF